MIETLNDQDKKIDEKYLILRKVQSVFGNFNEKEFVEYTKNIIPIIYNYINTDNDNVKKYCSDELIKKIQENKETFRISKDMDNARVAFAGIKDVEENENDTFLIVSVSILFYDNVVNNAYFEQNGSYDKYWNDIWIIKFKKVTEKDVINKCPNCGASMEFNQLKGMFTCNYCRNSVYYSRIDWEIVDIEVQK